MLLGLLVDAAQQLWGEKPIILFLTNTSYIYILIVPVDAPLKGF